MKNSLFMIALLMVVSINAISTEEVQNEVPTGGISEIRNAAAVSVKPAAVSCVANATGSFSIQINSGFYPVGEYNFILSWTPGVMSIDRVQGGDTIYFIRPAANIDNSAGILNFSDFQAGSLAEPVGSFSVATIYYTAGAAAGSTNLELTVNELLDTSGWPMDHSTADGALTVEPIPTPTATPPHWPPAANPRCDINEDGYINHEDLLLLQQDWHTWRLTPAPESQ